MLENWVSFATKQHLADFQSVFVYKKSEKQKKLVSCTKAWETKRSFRYATFLCQLPEKDRIFMRGKLSTFFWKSVVLTTKRRKNLLCLKAATATSCCKIVRQKKICYKQVALFRCSSNRTSDSLKWQYFRSFGQTNLSPTSWRLISKFWEKWLPIDFWYNFLHWKKQLWTELWSYEIN